MLHKLQFDVTFPPNHAAPEGRRLCQDLTLDTGFWAITGPNESGKSFIFEMARFILFGTPALRGAAEDYKTLKASGEFTIKGERYKAVRTIKTASLFRGADMVASGVTAVNLKIVQTLGFGLGVFDMACSINQGEVERLSQLTAGQRKQMIDQVLGIDALEFVGKWAMEEARLETKEAETIRRRLIQPVQPTQPAEYVPSSSIDLEVLQAEADELVQAEAFLAVVQTAPTKPVCKVDLPAENLKQFAEKRAALRETVAGLKARIATLPSSVEYEPDGLAAAEQGWLHYDEYQEALRWLQQNPTPAHTRDQLQEWENTYLLLSDWGFYDAQQAELGRLRHQLEHLNSTTCPSCTHTFALDQVQADKIKGAIAELEASSPPDTARPATPPVPHRDVVAGIQAWLSFDEAKHDEMSAVPAVAAPTIARAQIPVYRAQLAQVLERARDEAVLAVEEPKLAAMPDYEQMLVERTAYEAALPLYQSQLMGYETWLQERAQKQMRAQALQGARGRLEEGRRLREIATAFEAASDVFEADWARYSEGIDEADALEASADEHRKVREVMNVLRSLIKQHLMPSLNRVASHLLSQMTGGQRSVVSVDEDFNVSIDGQALDTLSGSGKACANLALRIGLGQVLTNRVFSVLLADEIDAAMDDFRAEQTSNVLCTLANSISQVLQVSHKSIESTNQIDLGVFSARTADLGAAA